jgi:hypothetical protein
VRNFATSFLFWIIKKEEMNIFINEQRRKTDILQDDSSRGGQEQRSISDIKTLINPFSPLHLSTFNLLEKTQKKKKQVSCFLQQSTNRIALYHQF